MKWNVIKTPDDNPSNDRLVMVRTEELEQFPARFMPTANWERNGHRVYGIIEWRELDET